MQENTAWKMNGFIGLLMIVILGAVGAGLLYLEMIALGVILIAAAIVLCTGMTIIQPNRSVVVPFFGKYKGSIRDSGLFLTIPFSARKTVSLRVRNFNSQTLKVNDIEGNPIEIAAVVVYRVIDNAKATYDVDDYGHFVKVQSESAIRHIASEYPYDTIEKQDVMTLRGNSAEVSEKLKAELQERLRVAGVEVLETRLTHLAYATEIAQAMLQRQQAAAIISARRLIVEGAVGMAQDAIAEIAKDEEIELDEERKANMINNLMVAIVADQGTQPVVNTGSMY